MNDLSLRLLCCAALFGLVTACTTTRKPLAHGNAMLGESIVLAGTEPARLAFPPLTRGAVAVRSSYSAHTPNTLLFEEGRDFILDRASGQIRRTPQSRIPDFSTNKLFGVEDFDHGKFPGFGNTGFFAFVDYTSRNEIDWPAQPSQLAFLLKSRRQLEQGGAFKMVAFGDSITAGGDATQPQLIFWQRWSDYLQVKYPTAQITAINGATGGDRTTEGLARLEEKVLRHQPDLVLVGFGMNDHNIGGFGTPLPKYRENLALLIDRIRAATPADIIVYSTFPPNPKWHYGSHSMEQYAAATAAVAREKNCAFADIYHNWLAMEQRKKPEDLLGNNINHPNDFGHWMYFEVLRRLGL